MKKDSGSWIYGLLNSAGTVQIFYRFSKCIKDYLQYLSAIFLLLVLLVLLVDILPRLQKADASWI